MINGKPKQNSSMAADKTTSQQMLIGSFIIVILLVVVIIILSSYYSNKFTSSAKQVEYTVIVLNEAEQSLSLTKEIESSANDYIINPSPDYQQHLSVAKNKAFDHIQQLEKLTKDNAVQQISIDSLKVLVNKRFDHSLKCIQTRNEKGFEAAAQLVASGQGKALTDKISELVNSIQQEENQLLIQRHRKSEEADTVFRNIFHMLLAAMIILLVIVFVIVRHSLAGRIKAEKRSQQNIKEITDYRSALDKSSIVAISDHKGVIQDVNDNFCKISKYNREELVGHDHHMLDSGHHSKDFIDDLWSTISMGKIWKGELSNKAKDGSIYWVDTTIIPFLNGQGKPYQYIDVRSDITGRKKAEQEAVNAFKEKGTVLNRISDGVISLDNDWRYTFLNDAALATHPLGKKETLGKVIWEIHPELEGTVFWDKYHEAMQTRKVAEFESYFAPSNTWYSVKVYPSDDGLTVFYRDVSERRKAEQALLQTLKEVSDYKFALNESSIVAITDQKGIIKYANSNFCKISKYHSEELTGQDHRIVNAGFHSKEFIGNMWTTIAKGKIWKGELKNKAKDGTLYWVDTTIVPFLNEEGKPYQYVAINTDITERKRAEENIKTTLKEISDYKYALDESSIVAITDQKGIIKYINDNFCKISKYSLEELLGRDHRIINSGYHSKEFIRNLWVNIAHGKIWKGELKNKAKDGATYWVDTTIVPFLNIEGKPYQYVAITADITERKKTEESIRATLKEISDYKYALDESSIVSITDHLGIIKYANNNFSKISKYSVNELIGMDNRIINSGLYPEEFVSNLSNTITNGKIWKGELKNRAKDGSMYWVDTTIIPFVNENGIPYQYVTIRTDITERKRAEDKLASSEMHFRSLIENSAEGIALTDEHFNNIYRSPAAKKIMGDVPKENTTSLTHPDDVEAINNASAIALANPGMAVPFQGRFLAQSGHYIWLEGVLNNLLHLKGVNAIVTNFRDVTQRKEAEEKIIKSEKIYKTIASSIPGSVICLLDTEYRYLLVEGDMVEGLGYSKEKLLGNKAKDVLPAAMFDDVESDFKKVLQGEIVSRESTRLGYDTFAKYIPLKDETDVVYAIMTVSIDVTKLKNAQRDISELNRSLEAQIARRTEQLRKTNKELEGFSYSVSHDLRAPLRIIDGFGQILVEDYSQKLDEEGRRIIDVIMNSAKKMGQLIDDLLNFSKLGRSEIRMSKVNMNQLVAEVLQETTSSGIDIPPRLTVNNLCPANGDRNLLKQVWVNLISNAIKYSAKKKEPVIEIGMIEQQDNRAYYIKDNGAGFDMQYADKLFGVFQRLHKEHEFSGTGVGLALVQRIIVRHEGTLWAEAEENVGATFYFTLPKEIEKVSEP